METLDDNKVKLSVEVEAKEFEAEVEKAFKKIARDVRLPGFRKGKVPRKVLEARFGSGIARGQALEDSIPTYFMNALSEHEVDMIGPPDYEIVSGEEEGDLAFDATIEVRPAVELSGYENLRVEIPAPEPTAEEVDERINAFLAQFAELGSVERPASDGDTVTMDITTTYDDEEIEGLTANDYSYRVGTGAPVAELDENLDGAKVGDSLEFNADHPDPDEDGELSFKILVKDIQEQVLPELSDEIVSDATDFTNVVDYRADLEKSLHDSKAVHSNNLWREKAVSELGNLVEEDPPEVLVDTEVRNQIEDMARRLAASGLAFEQYLQMVGQSIDDLVDQMREPAAESVKVDQALRALAAAEGLEAGDDDIDKEFETLSEATGAPVADLREQISTPNQLMMLKADVSKRQAVDWLFERVEVVDEDGNPIDKDALEAAAVAASEQAELDLGDAHDHDHAHDAEEEE